MYGLRKAIESKNTATAQLNNGMQISGTFVEALQDNSGAPAYLRTQGPTMLSYHGRLLIGHDKDYHAEGYGTPIGLLKQSDQPIGKMSYGDLRALGIEEGKQCRLEYRSGVVVEGRLLNVRRNSRGEIILLSFDECSVEMEGRRLFEPSWGVYDLCVGESVVSVFSGPADPEGFELFYPVPKEKTHRPQYDEKSRALHALYQAVRDIREGKAPASQLEEVWQKAQAFMEREEVWLLLLEMLEVAAGQENMGHLAHTLEEKLKTMAQEHSHLSKLIQDGLALISNVAIS
jgi:phenylalanine-4-hydroxylase